MRPFHKAINLICALLSLVLLCVASRAKAGGLYSQMVVPFTTERKVSQRYDKAAHALVLNFEKTGPSELAALDQYDERLVKRMVVKDLGPYGTEVKFILRDRDVRALVSEFKEPYRVTIDIFDADYSEDRDPTTGLPLGDNDTREVAKDIATPNNRGKKLKLIEQSGQEQAEAALPKSPEAPGRKLLVSPPSQVFATPEEFTSTLRQAQDGAGKAWRDFPPYIYPLKTAVYEEGLATRQSIKPVSPKVLSSAEAMAEYAGKLFNFGQEAKALVAYSQVLRLDQTVFDRDALHLWRFAEAHLGQGNLALAEGYFAALVQKHPASPLANFAKLRKVDIAALRLIQERREASLPSLLPQLDAIKAAENGELLAQLNIRRAWWRSPREAEGNKALPLLEAPVHAALTKAYPNVESSRTAFLTASLLLNDSLDPKSAWQRSSGSFAEQYFKRFSGNGAEPYRSQLEERFNTRLSANLESKIEAGKLVEAIEDFEALPKSLQKVKQSPKTAWALAEAYRKLGQSSKSVDLYNAAAKGFSDGIDHFKAAFWLSVTAGELAAESKENASDQSRLSNLLNLSRNADKDAEKTWDKLRPDERSKLAVAYKEAFEKTVNSPAKLRSGPKIVLKSWTDAMATKKSTQNGGDNVDWMRNYSPSGSAVILLTDLAKRFGQLGMTAERRQATSLLKNMSPKDFADDAAAKKVWASELINLAEEYRKSNEYLDSGRLFSQVGAEAENFEGRAEALYKGGLLLYRAGRRAEALEAFKKASEDGNNLFYANLAKERLSQLQ